MHICYLKSLNYFLCKIDTHANILVLYNTYLFIFCKSHYFFLIYKTKFNVHTKT